MLDLNNRAQSLNTNKTSKPEAQQLSPLKPSSADPEKYKIEFPETKSPYDLELNAEAKKALHEAGKDFQKSLGLDPTELEAEAQVINNSSQPRLWDHSAIQTLNYFFKDDSWYRYAFSLDNEIAEALDPTFDQLKAPTWIRNTVYRALWSMAFVTTGIRSVLEGIKDGNWISGLRKVTQDFISVVCATTAIARASNWIQEKIYDGMGLGKSEAGKVLKNILRPAATIFVCKHTIDHADPIGEYCGNKVVDFTKKFIEKNTTAKAHEKPVLQAA